MTRNVMRLFAITTAFLVAAALLFAPWTGAAPGAAGGGAPSGTLMVGLAADPESMDPYFVYHPSGFAVMEALFDSLVMAGWDGTLVPHLAESWAVLDATTIEFKLREGVTFHNGEPFDAAAVQFSIERVLDERLQSGLKARFESIAAVEIVDPLRVRIHLSRVDASIIWRLTELAMVPPNYIRQAGDAGFARRPVGTGPFRFVEWVRDDYVLLEANPDYFAAGVKGGPGVERVVFRTLPEDSTRVAELRAGGVDLIERVPVDAAPALEGSGVRVVPADSGRFFIGWFVTDRGGPLADVRVRQALNYAMDVGTITEFLFRGYALPIAGPFTARTLGYDPGVAPYPYDPARARALLAEAGYPEGFELVLDTTANRATEAQVIAGYLADIGVRVRIRALESSLFNTNWTTGDTGDIIAASWGAAGDPQAYLDMLVRSDGFLSRYANARADELIARSAVTLDPDDRAAVLQELQQVLRDDPAGLYLWSAADLYGVGPRVNNWRPHPTERLIVAGVFVE
ncbi:MAG: ABC transporter substrate-binding protein [Limnochordales bacterium]|nr:MAG: hypothetical protein DIU83_03000 [Bacillota bacterium]